MSDSLTVPVAFMDENANPKLGNLTICERNDDIELSFFLALIWQSKFRFLPDLFHHLLEFSFIEIDAKDRMLINFSGRHFNVTYRFTKDSDIDAFFSFIARKVRLSPHASNPNRRLLSRAGPTHSILDFETNIFPKVVRPNLVNSAPDPPRKLSAADLPGLFGRFSELYNTDVELAAFQELWPLLFKRSLALLTPAQRMEKFEANRRKYPLLKQQWEATTRRQLANFPKLLEVITTLESDIVASSDVFAHFADPERMQQIAFNVLLTVSFWNWNSATYTRGMVHLLVPLLETYVDALDGDNVRTPRGDVVPIETAEADIFWHFTSFFSGVKLGNFACPSNQPFVRPLLVAVRQTLREQLPDLQQLIASRLEDVLNWIAEEIALWFARVFRGEELRRLWVSAAGSASLEEFFRWFVIAVLLMIEPGHDFRGRALDLNTLLVNTAALPAAAQKKPR
jgi:hypothetical protein